MLSEFLLYTCAIDTVSVIIYIYMYIIIRNSVYCVVYFIFVYHSS